jgi:hypothetical protein
MTALLDEAPYAPRDDAAFLAEAVALTRAHLAGCADYARLWPGFTGAATVEELPWLHVGVFKHLRLRTELAGLTHQRVLLSSATTSGVSSQVALDDRSAALQARSSLAILEDFVGAARRPLIILDDARSLRQRGQVAARVAAALSLMPLAATTTFALDDARPDATRWDLIEGALGNAPAAPAFLVYGFSWVLWPRWVHGAMPASVRAQLADRVAHFVHSGGWKKLEASAVAPEVLERALLADVAAGSRVIDFYGLVEQNGVVFPRCAAGARHVPRWAQVIVRDPWTLAALPPGEVGLLQFVNVLADGAPYHSVLTEDLGARLAGDGPRGRGGPRFTLHGRVPKAELRGCANV